MDWKRIFDSLGMNGTRWQWRIMRWERNLKGLFSSSRSTPGQSTSIIPVIIFINLILFTLMVVHGAIAGLGLGAILAPGTNLLIRYGAQFWPLVIFEDQWWRCLTYAFTHGGLIHLAFNMVVLYQVGPLIESEIGKSRFIVLYTLTALTATGLGYLWHPMVPVVGASGSLFGLIGFAVTYYHRLGSAGEQIRNFMFRWAVFAFVFGLLVGADNAGHLGGALGGALTGLLLPTSVRAMRSTASLFSSLAILCCLMIGGSIAAMALSWFSF